MAPPNKGTTGVRRHPFTHTGCTPWQYLNVHVSAMPDNKPMLDFARLAEIDGKNPIFIGYVRGHDGEWKGDNGIAFTGSYRELNTFLADTLIGRVEEVREVVVKKAFLMRTEKELKGGNLPVTRLNESVYCHLVVGPINRKDIKADTPYVRSLKTDRCYKVVELRGFNVVELNEKGYGVPEARTHENASAIRAWCESTYQKAQAKAQAKAQQETQVDDEATDNPL